MAMQPNTVCKLSGIFSVAAPASDPGSRDEGGPAAQLDGPAGLPAAMHPGSPVAHLRPYLDLALDSFGPDRLMFGSDSPVCTFGASYADVVTAAVALTRS